jgi:Domain of unknown function (DUF4192)
MATPELSFATPTQLIAALPHLLGFIPACDIVVLLLSPSGHLTPAPLHTAICCPVDIDDEQAQRFPATCQLTEQEFPGAVLVAVCDPHYDDTALRTLHILRTALHRNRIPVHRILTTHTCTQADRWTDPDTGEHGPTQPHTDSPATALGVLEGRCIAPSRTTIQHEFDTADHAPQPDLEAQDIAALIADTASDLHHSIVGNTTPTMELAVRAAVVVTAHTALRDALLRLGVGHEHTAGRVWTHIAAHHRGRTRAELLTMAAISYYCADDTLRAALALTYAAAATQDDNSELPNLANMLQAALRTGMPPSRIRSLIPTRDTSPIPGTTL